MINFKLVFAVVTALAVALSPLPAAFAIEPPRAVEAPRKAGQAVIVRSNAEFATAIASALPGTTIELDASKRFRALVIPDGTVGVTIKSTPDGRAIVESEGARSPSLALGIRCRDISTQDLVCQGTNTGTDQILYQIVRVGYTADGSRHATTNEELCDRVEFVNCDFLGTPTGNTRIGLLGNANNLTVSRCRAREIHEIGADSQGIIITAGRGYLIEDCDLEAAGEVVLLGGSVSPVPGMDLSDLTFVRNRCAWNPRWKTERWQCKNNFEIKGCERARIANCRFERCWTQAQNGTQMLLTPRDGRYLGDIAVEDCTFLDGGNGVLITAADNLLVTDKVTGPIEFRRNTWIRTGEDGTGGGAIYTVASPDGRPLKSLTIEGDRWVHATNARCVMLFEGKGPVVESLTLRGCMGTHGRYGIIGGGTGVGLPSIAAWVRSAHFDNTIFLNADPSYATAYPDGVQLLKTP